jgi:hypothetical protein
MEDIKAEEAQAFLGKGQREGTGMAQMQPIENLFPIFSQLTQSSQSNSEIPGCALLIL